MLLFLKQIEVRDYGFYFTSSSMVTRDTFSTVGDSLDSSLTDSIRQVTLLFKDSPRQENFSKSIVDCYKEL